MQIACGPTQVWRRRKYRAAPVAAAKTSNTTTGIHTGSPELSCDGPSRSDLTTGADSASAESLGAIAAVADCDTLGVGVGVADVGVTVGVAVGVAAVVVRPGAVRVGLGLPGFWGLATGPPPSAPELVSSPPPAASLGGVNAGGDFAPPCQAHATLPPSGTFRPSTPMLEKIHLPSRPFDQ